VPPVQIGVNLVVSSASDPRIVVKKSVLGRFTRSRKFQKVLARLKREGQYAASGASPHGLLRVSEGMREADVTRQNNVTFC
jgi:hypothetical protein